MLLDDGGMEVRTIGQELVGAMVYEQVCGVARCEGPAAQQHKRYED